MDPNVTAGQQQQEDKKADGGDQQNLGQMGQQPMMQQPDMNDPNVLAYLQQQQYFNMMMQQNVMPGMVDANGQPIQQQPFYGYPAGGYAPQYPMMQPFYQPQPVGSLMGIGGTNQATQPVTGYGSQQEGGYRGRYNRGGYQGGNSYSQGGNYRGGYSGGQYGGGGYSHGGQHNGGQRAGGSNKNDSQKWKTQLCRHFDQHGTCTLGDTCVFAHGQAELRNIGDPIPPEVLSRLQSQTSSQPSAPSHYQQQPQPSYQRGGMQQRGGFGGSGFQRGGGRGGYSKPHMGTSLGGSQSHGAPGGYQQHSSSSSGHQSKEQPAHGSNYKTSLCKNFSQGSCKYANSCSFAHGDSELKKSFSADYSQQHHHQHQQQTPHQTPAPFMQPKPQPQPGSNYAQAIQHQQQPPVQPQPPGILFSNLSAFPPLGGAQPNAQ